MKPTSWKDFKVGDRVIDEEGDLGTIDDINGIHNIHVVYDNGGAGFYCQSKSKRCKNFYSPLTKIKIAPKAKVMKIAKKIFSERDELFRKLAKLEKKELSQKKSKK